MGLNFENGIRPTLRFIRFLSQGFTAYLLGMQKQLVCSGCGRVLRYKGRGRNVFCASCNTTTSVPAPGQDQLPPGAYPSQGYSPPQGWPPQGYPPAGYPRAEYPACRYPPGYPPRCYPFGPCGPYHRGCGLGAMIGGCAAACRGHHLPYGPHCWHGYCHGIFRHGS